MDILQRAPAQLLSFWRGLSRRRRAVVVLFALMTVVALGAFAYLSGTGEFRVLFANMSTDEIGAISAKLQAQNIPYRVDSAGTSVLVPEDRLVTARVALAADGFSARSGKGFEL